MDDLDNIYQNYFDLKSYSEQLVPALDDYKNASINYYRNTENAEYSNIFNNYSANINKIKKDVFETLNKISSDNSILNSKIEILNKSLDNEKIKNKNLQYYLNNLEGQGNGSAILINNSKEIYNEQYISNWDMFIGILIISGFLISVFRKSKAIIPTPTLPKV